jgi:predicted CxxxxCH...CXXCH cytochrome family protein
MPTRFATLTAFALAAWGCGSSREADAAPGATPGATAGTCTRCHGDANRSPSSIAAAPPRDTQGRTGSSAVGAHLAHLTGGDMRAAISCTDCHVVPGDAAHASQPLDLTWGTLARSGGVTPAWTAATRTCSNYCHGASMSGGSDPTPAWDAGPGAAACGTCHGVPPASGHPSVAGSGTARCAGCHPGTVKADGTIDVAGGKHVNGAVDTGGGGSGGGTGCASCHGSATSYAPPIDTLGGTSGVRVGAHQAHVAGKTFSDGLGGASSCPECHGATPTSTGHSDGRVQIGWGRIALATGGAAIGVDASNPTTLTPGVAATCTNSCHTVRDWKGTRSGGTKATWSWTDTNTACNACHGTVLGPLPPTGRHVMHGYLDCSSCHGLGYSGLLGSVAKRTHVDGAVQVSLPLPGTWSRTGMLGAGTCSSVLCHEGGTQSWWGAGDGGGD